MKLGKHCWGALEERGLGSGGRREEGGELEEIGEIGGLRQNKRRRSKLWKQMSVKSKFKDGSDSVISEYDIATYFTYTHTRAICHPVWTLPSGLHLSALFVPVS